MRVIAAFIIFSITFIRAEIYFQQDVDYDIEVTLNDTDKTLTAYEIINYKNKITPARAILLSFSLPIICYYFFYKILYF